MARTVVTSRFGEVSVGEDKMVHFPKGIIGFGDLKDFALIHDAEDEGTGVKYMQSLDDGGFALPVTDPLLVSDGFELKVSEKDIEGIGELTEDNLLVLVTLTAKDDPRKLTANFAGPIIVNTETRLAVQALLMDADADESRRPIYEYLKAKDARG